MLLFAFMMTQLIGAAAVAIVAWFAAGTIWNIHAGRSLMRWMQGGLPVLGSRTTVRWLGSTVAEMTISEAEPPFASVTLVIFLEPRDLPWWPISRSRGRRDTLIIRGVLRRAPAVGLEVLDPASWSGRDALPHVPSEWPVRESGLVVHYESAAAFKRAEALLERAQRVQLSIRRLAVRRTEPNFQLHMPLPDRQRPAREFFEAVHGLAEIALG